MKPTTRISPPQRGHRGGPLRRRGGLNEYYSLEIGPRVRVLDYQASFYRRFDRGWDCPGLEVAARQRPDGYDIEGRLPFGALEGMALALSPDEPLLCRRSTARWRGRAPRSVGRDREGADEKSAC